MLSKNNPDTPAIVLNRTTNEPACIMQTKLLHAHCTSLANYIVRHNNQDICLSKVARALLDKGEFFTIQANDDGHPTLVVETPSSDALPLEALGCTSFDLHNLDLSNDMKKGVH
tara:strand:+ start:218 stop:559 length:342 start_codon:yes stop_codon:yes gene_type:complete